MHYDLVDLRLFIQAVERGGIAPAARHANISVSALSERIKTLEQRAGVQLLTRSARGSRPTQAGLEFAALARAVVLQTERLDGAVANWKGRISGTIRLKANSTAISSFLPDVLASFLARHPEIVIDLEEETSEAIASALRAGDADIGICAGTANLDGLAATLFRVDQLVLITPIGHPLGQARSVAFENITSERFIGLDRHSAINTFLLTHAARLGRSINIRLRLRSFESVCRMVAAGAGVAVLPLNTIPPGVRDSEVNVVRFTDEWAMRNLVVCYPLDRPVSPPTQKLLNEIAAESLAVQRST